MGEIRTKLTRHEMEALQTRLERAFYDDFIRSGSRGQVLPSVNELADKYGVSAGVTRKFYKRLQDEGVIRTERRKGCFIQQPGLFHFQFQSREVVIGIAGYIDESLKESTYGPNAMTIQAMERLAVEHGWRIRFFNTFPSFTLMDDNVLDIAGANLDAIFLLGNNERSADVKTLQRFNLPILVTEQPTEGATCISYDNFQIGHLATTHLLEAGHQHIAFINAAEPDYLFWSDVRKNGFLAAMQEAKVAVKEDDIIAVKRFDPLTAKKALDEINEGGFTAICCANDKIVITLVRAGLDPNKIAVIGVDDDIECKSRDISSIQKPHTIIGEMAFNILVDYFDSNIELPPLVTHNGILIKRGSTINHTITNRVAGF